MTLKYKIGDILVRNNKPLDTHYDTDPKLIKIVDYIFVSKGDCCNGYKMLDLSTGELDKNCDYTPEFTEYYYNDIRTKRKSKLKKLSQIIK